MISTEKIEQVAIANDSNAVITAKSNKWNEQPHIGKYKLIKTIGKGNFAKVKLAQHVTTGKKVAVKVIDKTALNTSSLNKLFREVKIMKTLDHPNIVKLFEVIESERHVYLVMEFAPKGEVFDYLVQNGRMKEKEARQRFREIVSAIQYCHQKNIVHRDLKAENLLLGSDNQIKIADFGFANLFDRKRQLDTFCGSPPYAAPELFQGRKYDGPEVDVWSLGVILYTLVSGSLPFDGHNMRELRERVLRGKYRIPFYMSTDCEMLLKKMLVVNPLKRFSLLDVMKDKWLNMTYDDSNLQPYKEPPRNFEDPAKIVIMETLGFAKDEVLDSLYNAKFNNVTATYLLLDYDTSQSDNNTPGGGNKTNDSTNSLKNVSSYQNAIVNSPPSISHKETGSNKPNLSPGTSGINDQSAGTKGSNIARSGSAVESRTSTKMNGSASPSDNAAVAIPTGATGTDETSKSKATTITTGGSSRKGPTAPLRVPINSTKSGSGTASINNQISSSGAANTQQNQQFNEVTTNDGGDNLNVPNNNKMPGSISNTTGNTSTNWVKRNNTFTYADKNTASEIESKPVTRTKNMMNMLSHVTPATIPIPIEQTAPIHSTSNRSSKHHPNDTTTNSSSKSNKSKDRKNILATGVHVSSGRFSQTSDEVSKSDSTFDQDLNGHGTCINSSELEPIKPSATGDRVPVELSSATTNTSVSNDSSNNLMLVSSHNATPNYRDNLTICNNPNIGANPVSPASPSYSDTENKHHQQLSINTSSVSPSSTALVNNPQDSTQLAKTGDNTTVEFSDPSNTDKNNQQLDYANMLNKPRQLHSNNLFRSFTSKISSNKLIRRLTSHSGQHSRGKQDHLDPWTPMESSTTSADNNNHQTTQPQQRMSTCSTDVAIVSAAKQLEMKRISGRNTLPHKRNSNHQADKHASTFSQATNYYHEITKPRIMHLVFRKSMSSKLAAHLIIPEIVNFFQLNPLIAYTDISGINNSTGASNNPGSPGGMVNASALCGVKHAYPVSSHKDADRNNDDKDDINNNPNRNSLEIITAKQIHQFLMECVIQLHRESIQLEIEVFRMSRSSSSASNQISPIRIKKITGSSTRFKTLHKILVNKLSPVLAK